MMASVGVISQFAVEDVVTVASLHPEFGDYMGMRQWNKKKNPPIGELQYFCERGCVSVAG